MQPIIVTLPSKEIRRLARQFLAGHWGMVFLGMLLVMVMMDFIPQFFESCVPYGRTTRYNEILGENQSFSVIATFYKLFFSGVFAAGMASFFISFVRLRDINPGYVFNGFEYYLKTLGLTFAVTFFVFLWSLLLIVPGIIASFRYSQAFYILADDPTKGIMQCIEESKTRMDGNKAKYFSLLMSFLGWIILAAVPAAVIGALLQNVAMSPDNLPEAVELLTHSLPGFVATVIGMIPEVVVLTYLSTAQTVFYEIITEHMVFVKPEE